MIELHIANKNYSSWSMRPWVLMRELGIPFVERLHPFPPAGSWEVPRARSPSGKVPFLIDGDAVVWDSLAIVEYLYERHPGVWPADPGARAWARSAAAEMHAGFVELRTRCSMSCGVRVALHEVTPDLARDLERLGRLVAEGLTRFGGPFLAGADLTAVDAFYAPVAYRVLTYDLAVTDLARAYFDRLRERPAMRAWYQAGLEEPWRDEAHDREVLANGQVVSDLRAGA